MSWVYDRQKGRYIYNNQVLKFQNSGVFPENSHQREFADSVRIRGNTPVVIGVNKKTGKKNTIIPQEYAKKYGMDKLYKSFPLMYNTAIVTNPNYKIGNEIVRALSESSLTVPQKVAFLSNSYYETGGWRQPKQDGGPASGWYQFEKGTRSAYNAWRKRNNIKDDNAYTETKFLIDLFSSRNSQYLYTPETNRKTIISQPNYQTKPSYKSLQAHEGYFNDQAWKDWDSGDVNLTIKAFEGLLERAGEPALERRQRVSDNIRERYVRKKRK